MAKTWSSGEDDVDVFTTEGFQANQLSPVLPRRTLSSSSWSSGSSSPDKRSSGYSSPQCSKQSTIVGDLATAGLWVFAYGSLCWLQGFDYSEALTGCIKGYSRRFWQGNTTHRGTDSKPGRVATLVADDEGVVWGRAFKICGDAALPYLNNRECDLGGYHTTLATFYPRDSATPPFPAVLYVATPNNRHWLGESPLPLIADQIVSSAGNSGHNVEYLLRLAEFMRETIPEVADNHLFGLEELVREKVAEQKLCLKTLMGQTPNNPRLAEQQLNLAPVPEQAASSSQFSNRVPSKKLRCVNIN